MKILDLLSEKHVVAVCRNAEESVTFMEVCDYYFSIDLTKEQVLQLAKELVELVNDTEVTRN